MSCLGECGLPFYKLLRKAGCFEWSVEAQEALDGLKSLMTRAPILVPPKDKDSLLLYVAGTAQVVNSMVIIERQKEEGVLPLQHLVYLISEVLTDAKKTTTPRYKSYCTSS